MRTFQTFKTKFRQIQIAASVFLMTVAVPSVAGATDLQGYADNTKAAITTIGGYVSGIGFALAAVVGTIKYFKMTHAENDSDYHQSKKAVKWSIYGAIGAAIFGAVIGYIQLTYK